MSVLTVEVIASVEIDWKFLMVINERRFTWDILITVSNMIRVKFISRQDMS